MAHPIPSQIFDGSYYESIISTPNLKAPPPAVEAAFESPDNLDEIENFDWETYNRSIVARLPAPPHDDARFEKMRDHLGAQLWLSRRLAAPILLFLLRDTPPKLAWEWLGHDSLGELKHAALRGFQQTPGSLRREPVQKRIAGWLERHPAEVHLLLLRWGLRAPTPPALERVEAQPDEATLKGQLPSLLRGFGVEATFAALAFAGKPRVFKWGWDLMNDGQAFAQLIENAPDLNAPPAPDADAREEKEPEPDSPAAQFWNERAAALLEANGMINPLLDKAEALLAQNHSSEARLSALETQVENLKKREQQTAAQTDKKIASIEKKWKAKYEELERTHARSERRLRALLTQVEELEHENKRQKKQIRQGAQAREDERKKVVLLETRVSELSPDAPDANRATQNGAAPNGRTPVNAVSSPPTTQDAPNRPVKVERTTPLDEIFEWMADGRRVRVTAREVRRLIDKNDEDDVADIMLALEALEDSNPDLRQQFLARLKEAGPHYPRVLTNRTTRVLVDASNVARFCPNRYGKGRLSHLLAMRAELQRLDCWPIEFIADASLPYFIDQPNELREMARHGEVLIVDKGVEADEVLAREARRTGAYVVTNDAKFFYKVSPDYEPPRISFRVHDDLVIVDEF